MTKYTIRPVATIAAATLLSLSAWAQTPATPSENPTVKTNVDEVLLDLIVRDKKGKPVTDLKPSDVTVSDNGAKQTITSFRLVQGTEAISETGAATKLDPLQQIRLVTLAFDALGEADQRKQAKQAALDLIKGEQGTNVYYAVMAVNTRLLALQSFTKDKQALTKAIDEVTGGLGGPKLVSESADIEATLRSQAAVQGNMTDQQTGLLSAAVATAGQAGGPNTDNTAPVLARVMLNMLRMDQGAVATGARMSIDALRSMVQGLAQMPGRKSVIYFCNGLYVGPELDYIWRNLIGMANRANVTFYSVDTRGVMTTSLNSGATSQLNRATAAANSAMAGANATQEQMQADAIGEAAGRSNTQLATRDLAESTGGFLIGDSNDLRVPLRRVNEEISSYYELTYIPNIGNYDGAFRKIAVAADRKDLVIHARTGYFALPPEARASGLQSFELPLLKAISENKLITDVKFRSGALDLQPKADGTQVAVLFELPLHELTAKPQPGKPTVDVHFSLAGLVKNEKGEVVQKISRDRSLQNITPEQIKLGNFVDKTELDLAPGTYTLDAAVLDQNSSKIGTQKEQFTVSAPKGVGISSLVPIRAYNPNARADPNEPFQYKGGPITVTLDNGVPHVKDAAVRLFFTVYQDRKISAKPSLEIEVNAGGKTLAKMPMPLDPPDAQGRIPVVMTIPAQAIPPGQYEIRATAHQGDTTSTAATTVAIQNM